MKMQRDDMDKFFEYGINLPSRTLYIGSYEYNADSDENGVDFAMTERAIKGLHILDGHNSTYNGDSSINILLNSPGGDFYHGMGIYDAIAACRNHVVVQVYGYAMSMGSIITQAADKRLMSPNSYMMLHYGEDGFCGHAKIFEVRAEQSKRLNLWMENLYWNKIKEKHPKFRKFEVEKMLKYETFLSAEEAVELNLADGIIGE